MTPKSVGFKLGLIVALLHLLLVLLIDQTVRGSTSSTAAIAYLPLYMLDAPIFTLARLLPASIFEWFIGTPLVIFGLFGTALWFAIPWLLDRLLARFFRKASRVIRWIVVPVCLPVVVMAFIPLSTWTINQSVLDERPDELKALLDRPVPGALSRRTVLEDSTLRGICGIHAGTGTSAEGEVLVLFHRGAVRLGRDLTETSRVEFGDTYYQTVEPVRTAGEFDGRFLAYRFFKHAALLGPDGGEIWRAGEKTGQETPLAGVATGDIDGDGRPEFALYHTYRKGISLHDESGQLLWNHDEFSIGHIVMADVRGNGRQEILMRAGRFFRILDAEGNVAAQPRMETDSSGFALVHWPEQQDRPNLLFAEDNRIRIMDLDGNDLRELNAPGCRSYGDVTAVPVHFRAGKPPALAVRKNVHPDLAVLYVYDAENRLLHQRVETRMGGGAPALAAIPADPPGAERLLVGEGDGLRTRLVEYTLD